MSTHPKVIKHKVGMLKLPEETLRKTPSGTAGGHLLASPGITARSCRYAIATCVLVSIVLSALALRNGVYFSPDSWTYWEGSVSLIEASRYLRFENEPITEWPPLFSAYLAVVQVLAGQTGAALITAMVLVTGLNAAVWGVYAARIFRGTSTTWETLAFVVTLAFLALFAPLCSQWLLAHALLLAMVGGAYVAILAAVSAHDGRNALVASGAATACLATALLVHNSAVIYVGGAVAVLLANGMSTGRLWSSLSGATLVVLSLFPWMVVRRLLGQTASHSLGDSFYDLSQHLRQSLAGIGAYFLPVWVGNEIRIALGIFCAMAVVALVLFRRRLPISTLSLASVSLTAVSYGLLFVIFNVTWIQSPLSGRFLWFVPLALVPVLMRFAASRPIFVVIAAAFVLTMPSIRTATASWTGFVRSVEPDVATLVSDRFVRPWYFLTERYPARRPRGTRQVVPPTYRWLQRWHELEAPAQWRSRVRILPAS